MSRLVCVVLLSVACQPEPPTARPSRSPTTLVSWVQPALPEMPEIVAGPALVLPEPGVYLARAYQVTTSVPTTLVLTLTSDTQTRELAFPGSSTDHRVPVLELRPDTDYTVSAVLTAADGQTVEAPPQTIHTGTLPAGLPAVDVLLSTPDRMEPGITLFVAGDVVLGLDADGVVIYVQQVPDGTLCVVPNAAGDLLMVDGFTIAARSTLGAVVTRWTETPSAPEDVAVDFPDFHHDVVPQPDGSFWSLSYRHETVPEYPTGYPMPHRYAPATIRNDLVVHIAADGTTLDTFALLDLVDVHRIGFDALSTDPSGALDWVHANAVQYDADTDELTVSLRHQDAVVRFSRETGEVRWIFASPHGWPPELEPLLLRPTTPFVWPTHQHGVEVTSDGRIRMFDNGNDYRGTPYYDSGQNRSWSRIFEATIDPDARTVTPIAEYRETSEGTFYSGALGNADLLPLTGNRLGTWGTGPRIVEFAEDGTVVFEVLPGELTVDRAIRIPSLYPPGVVE